MLKYFKAIFCLAFVLTIWILSSCTSRIEGRSSASDLSFDSIPARWFEGVPLGNATVGALVWKKDSVLRMSLDRTDLWDLRPMDSISGPNNRFAWVKEQLFADNYSVVQDKFDWPYNREVAPAKIPGGALEFAISEFGEPKSVELKIKDAICEIEWENGATLKTFVHATEPIGWFVFENVPNDFEPQIVAPRYFNPERKGGRPTSGQSIERLGYEQGTINSRENGLHYHQPGWGDFAYDIDVAWSRNGNRLEGVWSVSSTMEGDARQATDKAMSRGIGEDFKSHRNFWDGYYAASSVSLPDSVMQKQYDNEMYKFGSATREHSYPISLQAVWTADDGYMPPWKGDYHHDLNTQLSYWPAYTGNHLTEGLGYLNTLWNQRDTYKKYTRQYFETDGMNVPGVCTLVGEPLGGWIQYAMSQTAGAWLAHHFYLHWKYSADDTFLAERAYPFINDVATYMEQMSVVDENGKRRLEISSSPEIFDNSPQAWFRDMTNYDLALMHSIFKEAAEVSDALGKKEEAEKWQTLYSQLPDYDTDEDGSLTFAPGFSYDSSHRHFSHALAIHPLGLLDGSNGEKEKAIVDATIAKLDKFGPDYWTGYSYAWLGNLKARQGDGDGSRDALKVFAECFCGPNTFHLNGDQTHSGKSRFTYNPFTLEGNFAFAAGVQEMLLQSHRGIIEIFPALPSDWKDVSFKGLRAMGGVLVNASLENGKPGKIELMSEKGGTFRYSVLKGEIKEIFLPAGKWTLIHDA